MTGRGCLTQRRKGAKNGTEAKSKKQEAIGERTATALSAKCRKLAKEGKALMDAFGEKRPPIVRETRWSRDRYYSDETTTFTSFESKFLEGTASITLAELSELWPNWNMEEKLDFCQALACDEPRKHAEILRFLMKHGDHVVLSTIALSVARGLPKKESLPFLRTRCEEVEVGSGGANYYQALIMAGDPDALRRLKEWLSRIMEYPRLGDHEPKRDYAALDLIWCLQFLLELGQDSETLRQHYEFLIDHPNPHTRQYAQDRLSEYFA